MLLFIVLLLFIIAIFFIVQKPTLLFTIVKRYMLRTVIAVLCIVCVNIIGSGFGVHLPVNVFTVFFTSLLGIPGMIMILGLRYLFL